jgi:hypothetical protein
MGAAAYGTAAWLASASPVHGEAGKLVTVFGAIGTALIVLAGAARVLRIDEFTDAAARVVQRFRR